MLTKLRIITSLNNLGQGGQVATLLVLMMVVVLGFILVTVNIGQTSLTATSLANAADSAALSLGSQLATKSHTYAEALHDECGNYTKCCKKGGWWVLACTVGLAGFGPEFILLGAYIGGVLQYGGHQGGMQGMKEGVKGAVTVVAGAGSGFLVGGGYGAIIGAVIGLAAATYQYYMEQRMSEQALAEAAKQLSKLKGKEQTRESVFYHVLVQTVDDPNDIQDHFDSDSDGNKEEIVPFFQYWWDRRTEKAEENIAPLTQAISSFLGALNDFTIPADTFIESLSRQEIEGADGIGVELTRALEQAGYDVQFYQPGTPPQLDPACTCADGGSVCEECDPEDYYDEIEKVVEELTGFMAFIEMLGKQDIDRLTANWETLVNWFFGDIHTIEEYPYAEMMETLIEGDEPDFQGVTAWKGEVEDIRDSLPDSELAYRHGNEELIITNYPSKIYQEHAGKLNRQLGWIKRFLLDHSHLNITSIECFGGHIHYTFTCASGSLSSNYDFGPGGFEIPYCSYRSFQTAYQAFAAFVDELNSQPQPLKFATIDEDTDDEFKPVLTKLDDFITSAEALISAMNRFYNDVQAISSVDLTDFGGTNPVTYSWSDSRGEHSVTVKTGDFKFARVKTIKKKKHGGMKRKTCLVLKDYSDDGTHCWVRVTRKDPANKDTGILGKWNRTAGGGESEFSVSRISRVAYSYNYVEMSSKKE